MKVHSKHGRGFSLAMASMVLGGAVSAQAAVLLNDSFTDGNRNSTSLPTDSPVWIGQSAGNGSNSVSAGDLHFALPTNSLKFWTYFTSDNSAPNTNATHNAVTTLGVGDTLTASTTFFMTGLTATTGKNFRVGLFVDPTDARVESDTNSDSGGSTNPWTDATGYAVQFPLSSASGNNPLLLEKRTVSGQTSLLGSAAAYTAAGSGGAAYAMANDTNYTLQISLAEVSAAEMDMTVSLMQGATVLSTVTKQDLGATFGGTAVAAGGLTGSQSIYNQFDQLFFRNSDATQATTLDFTNNSVVLTPAAVVPEPTSAALLAIPLCGIAARRRKRS